MKVWLLLGDGDSRYCPKPQYTPTAFRPALVSLTQGSCHHSASFFRNIAACIDLPPSVGHY